eukprot:gnl/MRDRNA2_/MRDRNA2_28117_c0_seq1.p1 gnl/MRDRNA2_/MRDRNA2_28117_c0~~gnl/MRDRNA2_/MRDRNA2_28117_c0_seq1.p1  ORF type:complete len:553 (-),score=85.00 gnl/MRDRNA2_/MRDRNA2_28117_c0_seq1:48-1706(-)
MCDDTCIVRHTVPLNFVYLLWSLSWPCTLSAVVPQPSRISVSGEHFVDEHGRVRIFHGFNDLGHTLNEKGNFSGTNYLPQVLLANPTRMAMLVEDFGFNCFRLPAMWAAVQPAPNTIDSRYLMAVKNATRLLASHGAYSILDMHTPDMLSSLVNEDKGDGAPQWLVKKTQWRHKYPWPYKHSLDKHGHMVAEAVGQTWGEIYKDTHGGLQAWAEAWKAFAAAFRNETSIVAYELINEPFPGDIYRDPLLLVPGVAGSRSLQAAYDTVAKAIRSIDDTTVIMYEPVTWGMVFPTFNGTVGKMVGSGFSHVPGGPLYVNHSAYSYHYYCWLGRTKNSSDGYSWLKRTACDSRSGLGPRVFESVRETRRSLGGASFMTEFGGVYFTPDANQPNVAASQETAWLLDKADAELQSWTFWDLSFFFNDVDKDQIKLDDIKGCGRGDSHCIRDLVRPYAQAVAGTPLRMHYSQESRVFSLTMRPDATILAPTEVFVPPICYPQGFSVQLQPSDAPFMWTTTMCASKRKHSNVLCLSSTSADVPDEVTLRLLPKTSQIYV